MVSIKKNILTFSIILSLLFLFGAKSVDAYSWWWPSAYTTLKKWYGKPKTDSEILDTALTSNNPKKVEVALDYFIEKSNIMAVVRIRDRINKKIFYLNSHTDVHKKSNLKKLKKELARWGKLNKKAEGFVVKKH